MAQVSLVGFFSPSSSSGERGERATLGVSAILALSVVMVIVGDFMPKGSAENFPALGKLNNTETDHPWAATAAEAVIILIILITHGQSLILPMGSVPTAHW